MQVIVVSQPGLCRIKAQAQRGLTGYGFVPPRGTRRSAGGQGKPYPLIQQAGADITPDVAQVSPPLMGVTVRMAVPRCVLLSFESLHSILA